LRFCIDQEQACLRFSHKIWSSCVVFCLLYSGFSGEEQVWPFPLWHPINWGAMALRVWSAFQGISIQFVTFIVVILKNWKCYKTQSKHYMKSKMTFCCMNFVYDRLLEFYNNNLVQYRLRQCWCVINTFIRVLPKAINYVYGHSKLLLHWLRVPCWFFCNLGLKNCLHVQGLNSQPEKLVLKQGAFDSSAMKIPLSNPDCYGDALVFC